VILSGSREESSVLIDLKQRSLRVCAWFCTILLAYLSLIPGDLQVRTGAPTLLEHFAAYFGTAMFFMLGYPRKRVLITASLMVYAGFLELGQLISPGRFASIVDATASISGVGAASALAILISSILGEKPDLAKRQLKEQPDHS
jgi:VanZ family protein